MSEWDALCAEREELRAARSPDDHAADEAEAAVLARMDALETRINTFLGHAARQRPPINGPLVMGTLVSPAGARTATPQEPPSSRKETD